MGGEDTPAPVDGASNVPPPADPNLPSDVPPAGEDGSVPPMDGEQSAPDAPMGGEEDPAAMGGEPMGDAPEMGGEAPAPEEGGDDSTISIINQLSPTDREAVRSYAESMLNREEDTASDAPEGEEAPLPDDGQAPIMESFVFTKGQLKKIHENLLPTEPEKEKLQKEKKHSNKLSGKSPFKSPKFN